MSKRERIRALRAEGKSYAEIGSVLGVPAQTAQNWGNGRGRYEPQSTGDYQPRTYVKRVKRAEIDTDIEARLAEIPPDTRTLDERLNGTPLRGRSYLDRMMAGKLEPASEDEVPFE